MANNLSHLRVTEHDTENDIINPVYKKGQNWAFSMPESDVDVHSIFTSNSLHRISICSRLENGRLDLNAEYAAVGSVITIVSVPDSGYRTNSVTCTGGVSVTAGEIPSTYTFVMPDSNVTVCAEFLEGVESDVTVAEGSECLHLSHTGSGNTYSSLRGVENNTIYVTPDSGKYIKSVSVVTDGGIHIQCTVEGNGVSFIMPPDNVTVSGECASGTKSYKVLLSDTLRGGVVEASPLFYNTGESVHVTLFPTGDRTADIALYEAGGEFTNINLTGQMLCHGSRTGSATGPSSDMTVYASFGDCRSNKNQHKIKVHAAAYDNSCDEISILEINAWPSKDRASEGEIITISWNSDVCCEFRNIGANVQNLTTLGPNTFVMPDADVNITVYFKGAETHKILTSGYTDTCQLEGIPPTFSRSGDGTPIEVNETSIYCGDTVSVSFFGTDETLVVSDIRITGNRTGKEIYAEFDSSNDLITTYTFIMPSEDVDVRYCFSIVEIDDGGGGGIAETYNIITNVEPLLVDSRVMVNGKFYEGKDTISTARAGGTAIIIYELNNGEKISDVQVRAVSHGHDINICSTVLMCERKLNISGNYKYMTFTMPRCDVFLFISFYGGGEYLISACPSLSNEFINCTCATVSGNTLSDIGKRIQTGWEASLTLKKIHSGSNLMVTATYGSNNYIPVLEKSLDEIGDGQLNAYTYGCNDGASGGAEYIRNNFNEYVFNMPATPVTVCYTEISAGNKRIHLDTELGEVIEYVKVGNGFNAGSKINESGSTDNEKIYGPVESGKTVTVKTNDDYLFVTANGTYKVYNLDDSGNKISYFNAEWTSEDTGKYLYFTMPSTDVYLDWYAISLASAPTCNELGYYQLSTSENIHEDWYEYGIYSGGDTGESGVTLYIGNSKHNLWDYISKICVPAGSIIRYEFRTLRKQSLCSEGSYCRENACFNGNMAINPTLTDVNGNELTVPDSVEVTPYIQKYSFTMPSQDCTFDALGIGRNNYYISLYKCENAFVKVWDTEDESAAPILDSTNQNKKSVVYNKNNDSNINLHAIVAYGSCYKSMVNGRIVFYDNCNTINGVPEVIDYVDAYETVTEGGDTVNRYNFTTNSQYMLIGTMIELNNDFTVNYTAETGRFDITRDYECTKYGDTIGFYVERDGCDDVYEMDWQTRTSPYNIVVTAEGRDSNNATVNIAVDSSNAPYYTFTVGSNTGIRSVNVLLNAEYSERVFYLKNSDTRTRFLDSNGSPVNNDIRKILLPDAETSVKVRITSYGLISVIEEYLTDILFNTSHMTLESGVTFGTESEESVTTYADITLKVKPKTNTGVPVTGIPFEVSYNEIDNGILLNDTIEETTPSTRLIGPSEISLLRSIKCSGTFNAKINGSNSNTLPITVPEVGCFINGGKRDKPICGIDMPYGTFIKEGFNVIVDVKMANITENGQPIPNAGTIKGCSCSGWSDINIGGGYTGTKTFVMPNCDLRIWFAGPDPTPA